MKKAVLPILVVLSLTGCQKAAVEPEPAPADTQAAFEADFSLQHQQQAFLPGMTQPELTVRLEELKYTFCPEGLMCFVGPSAWPELNVTDAQGRTQRVVFTPFNAQRVPSTAWLDTTSVRANNRRYVFTYQRWQIVKPLGRGVYPGKSDFTLWFRINRIGK
ncbi:hypothetical protein [Hymenobacter swuensis]|uniref:hypothetical protein n=1 Tax=Hymenobacter swuensis TaxID=1446467 RepID=UPI0012DC3784|nr:hypothetical protein [Hymenobacter swuensis]